MTQLHRKLAGICFLLLLASCGGSLPEPETESSSEAPSSTTDDEPRGIRVNEPGASSGYVLFTPLTTTSTYLIDRDGQVVHTWKSDLAPGTVYLLDNGNLLRTAKLPEPPVFSGGGQSGRIREIAWDGEVVWDFVFATAKNLLHHDVERLPNGNLLAIAWESKSAEQSRQAGRRESQIPEAGLWPDVIFEFEPQPPDSARIVWEWHAWDHLIQSTDESLSNFGDPSEHPERIDINGDVAAAQISLEELEQLKALGYVPEETQPEDLRSDLFHTNAVNYNPQLDQIVMSSPRFDEIWVIDHSTTTEEAAGSSGGRWGRGVISSTGGGIP